MSSVPCGIGKREDGIIASSFYPSSIQDDRSKVKAFDAGPRGRVDARDVPVFTLLGIAPEIGSHLFRPFVTAGKKNRFLGSDSRCPGKRCSNTAAIGGIQARPRHMFLLPPAWSACQSRRAGIEPLSGGRWPALASAGLPGPLAYCAVPEFARFVPRTFTIHPACFTMHP